MSAQNRLVARVLFEMLCIVAGWGLLIAAVAAFIGGNGGLALLVFAGGMLAFFVHSRSFRNKKSWDAAESQIGERR